MTDIGGKKQPFNTQIVVSVGLFFAFEKNKLI